MNTEALTQIMQWLIPSGFVGSLWAWLRHRDTRKAAAAKDRSDAYHEMYNNLSETLIDLQNENLKLYKAVRELNRTLQKAFTCKHYNECPVAHELQHQPQGIALPDPPLPKRQRGGAVKKDCDRRGGGAGKGGGDGGEPGLADENAPHPAGCNDRTRRPAAPHPAPHG